MGRRTINLPESTESDVRELARPGESFSAAVTRLLDEGVRVLRGPRKPTWVGAGEGPADLGVNAEKYLRDLSDGR